MLSALLHNGPLETVSLRFPSPTFDMEREARFYLSRVFLHLAVFCRLLSFTFVSAGGAGGPGWTACRQTKL